MKGTLLGVFTCLLSIICFAQTKTVKVSGKITDGVNGSPLVGATVLDESTQKGTKTDVEGNFFISAEDGKSLSLRISIIGYQTKVVSEIQASESLAPLSISLTPANESLSGVVVRSNARRESVASLYVAQKNSSAISDAISAEIIRKSPDRNTSEVLRRVSGTSIQDNKFVVVRGLVERYNTALLNNSVLPSTEPDKKAFSFDIIPSSLIDNITIYKSATPDLPGDFAGGVIKIATKDYPARPISELSVSVGYNTLTTFKNFYKGYPAGKWDWLGFFDNSRLIPGSYYANRGAGYAGLSDATKMAITKQFPNTYGFESANQSQPNFSVSYTGGGTKLIKENKLGVIYSVTYNHGRRVAERVRSENETYGFQNYYYNTANYDMRSTLSGLLNLTYSYGKSKLSLKNLYNNDFVNSLGIRSGLNTVNPSDPFTYKSTNTEAASNGILNSVLEGMHSLAKGWTIDWNASYGLTYRWQPDQRILTYTSDPNTANYFIKLNNQNSPDPTLVGRVYSYLYENIYGGSFNVVKQFEWKGQTQKFKFGSLNYYRDRNVEVNALGLATTRISGIRIAETKSTTYRNLLSPENIDQYGILYANIPANSTDYDGTALLNSGYAMLDNKFSDKVKLSWGVRVERYLQELKAKGKATTTVDNTDVLPSFLLTYALNTKTNIRLAGSQAVNRPEFRELADYRVYDYENSFIVSGKPGLKRSKISNADLRFEMFPSAGEIISASVFYKYFQNPIEQTNQGNDVLSFDNATKANVYGVEVELRKKLDFIGGGIFNQLTFYTNAAYIKGSVKYGTLTINSPLQGQSPYLINSGLTYTSENDGFSANLLYNRIGQRLKFRAITASSGAGRNIFEKPRDVIDFQISKKLLKNKLEAKLTVSDLLAQPFSWYYKYDENPSKTSFDPSTDRLVNTYKYGTTVSIGLKYSFK